MTLAAAVRWLRRRVSAVHRVLATVIGLRPERFEGCAPTVASFRERLGTSRVLVALRGICARTSRARGASRLLGARPGQRPGASAATNNRRGQTHRRAPP